MSAENFRTRQEIFDLAWNGLKSQGFKQSVNSAGCAYRGGDNRRCALGYCIDDAAYDPALEGRSAHVTKVRAAARISDADASFADVLQACHDEASGPAAMEAALREFAATRRLSVPV